MIGSFLRSAYEALRRLIYPNEIRVRELHSRKPLKRVFLVRFPPNLPHAKGREYPGLPKMHDLHPDPLQKPTFLLPAGYWRLLVYAVGFDQTEPGKVQLTYTYRWMKCNPETGQPEKTT